MNVPQWPYYNADNCDYSYQSKFRTWNSPQMSVIVFYHNDFPNIIFLLVWLLDNPLQVSTSHLKIKFISNN